MERATASEELLNLTLGGATCFTDLLNIHLSARRVQNNTMFKCIPTITQTGSGVLKIWARF